MEFRSTAAAECESRAIRENQTLLTVVRRGRKREREREREIEPVRRRFTTKRDYPPVDPPGGMNLLLGN